MIATHVDDVPGVATSGLMIEYILGAIRVVYACEHVPWKKVLGFKVTVNDNDGTVSMSCEAVIEAMHRAYLKGQLTYDAKLPMRDLIHFPHPMHVVELGPFGQAVLVQILERHQGVILINPDPRGQK